MDWKPAFTAFLYACCSFLITISNKTVLTTYGFELTTSDHWRLREVWRWVVLIFQISVGTSLGHRSTGHEHRDCPTGQAAQGHPSACFELDHGLEAQRADLVQLWQSGLWPWRHQSSQVSRLTTLIDRNLSVMVISFAKLAHVHCSTPVLDPHDLLWRAIPTRVGIQISVFIPHSNHLANFVAFFRSRKPFVIRISIWSMIIGSLIAA